MENMDNGKKIFDEEPILEPMTKEQLNPENWRPCSEMVFQETHEETNSKPEVPLWFKSERLF